MPLTPMHGREKDIQMMSTPDQWPRWPRLPVKRSHPDQQGQVQVAVMLAAEEHLTTVWLTDLFKEIKPEETPKIDYESYEDLADDGWVVD